MRTELKNANLVRNEVVTTVAGFFQVDPNQLNMKSGLATVEGWNSLTHLKLILHLENHFQVQFRNDQLIQMNTIEKIVDSIFEMTKHE